MLLHVFILLALQPYHQSLVDRTPLSSLGIGWWGSLEPAEADVPGERAYLEHNAY